MRCRSCNDDTLLETVIGSYTGRSGPALYLFSGPVLAVVLGIAWFFWHSNQQKQTESFLAKPTVGDVYTLEEDSRDGTKYNFLRVAGIAGDTVMMLENRLEYTGFVSDLADDDYFNSSDTFLFARRKLTALRADKVLTNIQRDFAKTAGFNRIKTFADSTRSE